MSHVHVQRLTVIQDEYSAVFASVEYIAAQWNIAHTDSIFLASQVKFAQIRLAQQNVSDTYIVRAFSEFEDILRQEVKVRGYKVPYKTEALVNRAALMSKIANDVRLEAHQIREYRNRVVHRTGNVSNPILFGKAFSSLNKFLAGL